VQDWSLTPKRRKSPPTFFISGYQLGVTEHFTYPGSIITSTCDLTAEIQHRVNLAFASFGRLSKRVFTKRNLSTRTKMDVYNASCVSTLLYACEGGHPTVVVSEPSRLFTFDVFKLSCTCTGGQNTLCQDLPQSRYNMSRDDTPQKTTEVAWPCDKNAWKQNCPSPTLQ